mmetsp:Transcript_32880/g.97669  ORF Transcript_32880/g.97669 Transcript_32880/m.97669 type:complete len:221 (+) Transcript_32880:686-1348(+)
MYISRLSRTTARSLISMVSLSRARSNCSSLLMCHRCLSWMAFNCCCRDFSSADRDFFLSSVSISASSSSVWSFRLWIMVVSQSWYFIFSSSSSSRSSPLESPLVENALVFRSRSKSLNLCMSFSILFRASSNLSFELFLMSVWAIHSRIWALSRCNLLMDFFSSSPSFSLWAPADVVVACSNTCANSSMPSSTFFRTTSMSFCSFRCAAAVMPTKPSAEG